MLADGEHGRQRGPRELPELASSSSQLDPLTRPNGPATYTVLYCKSCDGKRGSGWGEAVFISKLGSLRQIQKLWVFFFLASPGPKFLPQHPMRAEKSISPASFMTSSHTQKKVPRDPGLTGGKTRRKSFLPHISAPSVCSGT